MQNGPRDQRVMIKSKFPRTPLVFTPLIFGFLFANDLFSSNLREAAEAKKRETALKKAERDAELAKEEASTKTVKTSKSATKKPSAKATSSGLDAALASMDSGPSSSKKASAIHASGIDDALDALSLTAAADTQHIDRHPERRLKAAHRAYEERRMKEGKDSGEFAGLRQNQIKERIWEEFQKSEENPMNKANTTSYDAKKDDIKKMKQSERDAIESRLGRDL